MIRKLICLLPALCFLASAESPTLRGGNILASETYSYRELIRAGKLDMLTKEIIALAVSVTNGCTY